MIRRVFSGSFGSANKTASAVCGKRSVRISRGQWRRHYVFIRVTNLQLFVGNTIHITIKPAVLYALLPYVLFIRLIFISNFSIPQTPLQFGFARLVSQSYIFRERFCRLTCLKFREVIYSQKNQSSMFHHSNQQSDVRV